MKKTFFWLGMLAAALTFGMTVFGCDDGSKDDNGGNNDGGGNKPLTWTSIENPFGKDINEPGAVAYGGDKFVVITRDKRNDKYSTAYSTDGVTWTRAGDTSGDGIAYCGGRFVTSWEYSTDGITWTELPSGSRVGTHIVYGGGKFVTGRAYSTDGITWTTVNNSAFGDTPISAIAYGGGKFVAVGSYITNKIAYSTDGITWTAVTNNPFASTDIAYGNNRFVAIGSSKIAYSTDGETWTEASGTGSPNSIAFGGGRFVTDRGYSSDGVTWTQKDVAYGTNRANCIAYGAGRFVAVGIIGGGPRIAYSNVQE